jgi:hypothetical protein
VVGAATGKIEKKKKIATSKVSYFVPAGIKP